MNSEGMTDVDIKEFASGIEGEVLTPGHPEYESARFIYNAMFDRRPALIVRCKTTKDVVASVRFAKERSLLTAVRAGGHSIAGFSTCDGGIVIDLRPMNGVTVDAAAKTAKSGGGANWAEFDAATQAHGLGTPGGFVSTTGVAGLTLNGGYGFLSRKHGLTCDNLIEAQVVTADGDVLTATDTENADLFWGLRGGGGNFGIVTEFTFRLHPVSEVAYALKIFPAEKGVEALKIFREAAPEQADEVLMAVVMSTVPENPLFPPELHGKKTSMVLVGHLTSLDEANRLIEPFSTIPDPLMEMAMPMPYQMAQMIQDADRPPGNMNYWKSGFVNDISDELIEKFVRGALEATSPMTAIAIFPMAGAIARVGEDDTPYSNRDAKFVINLDNVWEDPAENEKQIEWSKSFFARLKPHLAEGVYLNFVGDASQELVRAAYGPKYDRLVELKNKYDPTNLFSLNQNIRPTS